MMRVLFEKCFSTHIVCVSIRFANRRGYLYHCRKHFYALYLCSCISKKQTKI